MMKFSSSWNYEEKRMKKEKMVDDGNTNNLLDKYKWDVYSKER